jgi:hypothetical protein
MPSRGNGWQTPFSTRGSGPTLDVRWALDSPVRRPDRGKRKRLRVNSVHKKEKKPGPPTGIGRSRSAPALVAPVRQREVTAIVYGGTRHPGSETSAEPGSWALDRTYLPRQAEATQERCRSWRTRISTSTPSPISWSACGTRFSSPCRERVMRVEVHLSDQNADREGNEFGISRATGRVVSAFRRGSFEVTAWDGRPLSCCGSCG